MTSEYPCDPYCRKFSSNSAGAFVWMLLICVPRLSRIQVSPLYAPPFQDWSEMGPGVSSATLKEDRAVLAEAESLDESFCAQPTTTLERAIPTAQRTTELSM